MSVDTFFSKIIMVIRNHHRVLGCTVCSKLSSGLDLPIPRSRLEDVLQPSTAGCPWGDGWLLQPFQGLSHCISWWDRD